MANTAITIPSLGYANTFGDWVATTNALVVENNAFAANDFIKPTGTLILNSPTLGLQTYANAIIQGALQVTGTGSYVQNDLSVRNGTLYANSSNTGLYVSNNATINGVATIAGGLNVGPPIAGAEIGLNVANNVTIGSYLNVTGNSTFSNAVVINAQTTISNNAIITGNTAITGFTTTGGSATVGSLTSNSYINGSTLNIGTVGYIGTLNANTLVNVPTITSNTITGAVTVYAGTLNVSNTAYANSISANLTLIVPTAYHNIVYSNNIQANVTVNAAALSSPGTGYFNVTQSNTAVNTASLSVVGTSYENMVVANTYITAPTVYATNLQANVSVNTASMNTITLDVTGNTYLNNLYANGVINTPSVNVTGTGQMFANNTTGYFKSIVTSGNVIIGGAFTITGATLYQSNTLVLNSNVAAPLAGVSGLTVYRGGGSYANAVIGWNESSSYWQVADVNNNGNYSQVLSANSITSNTQNGITTVYNSTTKNVDFQITTSAVTPGTYGTMTQVPSIVVDKFGRIQNVQSITIDSTINVTGNYGTGSVNLVSQILQVTSSNAQVINVASSGNTVWVNAVQTSVTSGYYGNNTIIPVLQLDSYGRVLSVTNTAISSSLALSGTSGTGTVSLVNQTLAFTSGNGVNINVSSNTVNVNTAQDIRTTASPTFANVTSSGDSFFNSVRVGNGANNANYSTALGRNALASQTNLGNYNTAGGYNGLTLSTSGTYNSTFGAYGLSSLITGTYNSSFGAQSLASATTSANNSAFGAFSQYNTTIGGNNSSFGTATLFKNTSGTYNSAFGDNALGSATTANNNSAFGSGALKSDNSIGYNSAFGANTLQSSLYGTYNTVMGANAASSMANGAYNTIIGAFAGYAFISGTGSYSNSHTFVGGAAGQSLYTGTSNNTFIGANSGGLVTTGSNNTILGAYRGATTPINATGNNWVVLSDGAGNVRASMDANSNMLVGVTNTQATSNSLYVSNRIGFANTAGASGVSVVYQIYNQSTNSLDTIFG